MERVPRTRALTTIERLIVYAICGPCLEVCACVCVLLIDNDVLQVLFTGIWALVEHGNIHLHGNSHIYAMFIYGVWGIGGEELCTMMKVVLLFNKCIVLFYRNTTYRYSFVV
jgi:hypothetical protein